MWQVIVIFLLITLPFQFLPQPAAAAQTRHKAFNCPLLAKQAALVRAENWTNQGAFSQARDELELLLKAYPQDASVHMAFAQFLRTIGSLPAAIEQYKQAIKLNPAASEPYISLAEIYLGNLDNKQALYYAKKATTLAPSSTPATMALVAAEINAGQLAQAGQDLTHLLAERQNILNPDIDYLAYKYYLAQGQLSSAKQFLDDAIRLKPKQAHWLINQSDLYQALGDYTGAKLSLTKLLLLEPHSIEGLNRMGTILEFYFQDFEGARQKYQAILNIDPDYVAAIAGLDRCLAKKNDLAGQLKLGFWRLIKQLRTNFIPQHGAQHIQHAQHVERNDLTHA